MLDIPSISAVVAAIGVIVGVTLAYLEVRSLAETRRTDLVISLYACMLVSCGQSIALEIYFI